YRRRRRGGGNRRQCNAGDSDGRRSTLTAVVGGESPVNAQNRVVYSFAAQTSPIPAAIERRYVGVGNRSRPLGRDRSAHILGHRRVILAGAAAGVSRSGGSNAAAALKPRFRRHPPRRRGRGLLSPARPLLGGIFQ